MTDVPDAIPLRRAPTDVLALLRGTIEALQAQAAAIDVSLTVKADGDIPPVVVDPEKIAWAVATLVGNALRYVPHGTRRLPGGTIAVGVAREGDVLVVSVEDDGPGIPPEKLEKLFVRGRGVTHGTGLGLMLVQDVVAAHGGTVEVESRRESFATGTTVRLRIPLLLRKPA